jgi:hypothetical protein
MLAVSTDMSGEANTPGRSSNHLRTRAAAEGSSNMVTLI